MIRKIVIAIFAAMFVLVAAPSMSAVAGEPDQAVQPAKTMESVRAEAEGRRRESIRVSEKQIQTDSSSESVDCFYESNRNNPDCSDSKAARP